MAALLLICKKKQGHDGIHWMAVSADPAVHAAVDDLDDSQDDDDNDHHDHYNNSSCYNSRTMR